MTKRKEVKTLQVNVEKLNFSQMSKIKGGEGHDNMNVGGVQIQVDNTQEGLDLSKELTCKIDNWQ